MNYGKVLNDSFNIFWTQRSLWLFGVMAALFGQSDYSFRVNFSQSLSSPGGGEPSLNPLEGTILERVYENPMPYLIALVILSLIWWVISTVLGWLAQGALIGMVDEIDRTGFTSLGQGWDVGRQHAFPLFVIAFILALPLLVLLIIGLIMVLPFLNQVLSQVFYSETFNPDLIMESLFRLMACLIPLACIGFFLGVLLRLLNLIAARSCVLEGLGPLASLKRGWSLLIRNIGYILLNWLILGLVGGTFGAVVGIPALLLWIPAAGAFLYEEWSFLAVGSLVAALLYQVVIGLGVGGILTSFNSTLWTKLYKAFLEKEAELDTSVISRNRPMG
jgi:hypothetical protein